MADCIDLMGVPSLFMVGLPGTELDESTRSLISRERIHNFILFKRNFQDREQLKRLCKGLREACIAEKLPSPLISIDQEGGRVARLSEPFTVFPDQRDLAESDRPAEKLKNYARICALELKEVGINMNLAPVLDVSAAGQGLFMERRCLGEDPALVSAMGKIVICGMQDNGLAACAKHFPGLGSAALDPHLEIPVVDFNMENFADCDLKPFRMAIEAEVASIMTSHAVYSGIDDLPGTLSRNILHGLLRKKCGYDGLIITDDMEMGAIEKFMEFTQAVIMSFEAGADMLLICHDHEKIRNALKGLSAKYSSGDISKDEVKESLKRQAAVINKYK